MKFPDKFTWGCATASYQVEGSRGLKEGTIWDKFCEYPGVIADGSNGSVACDHVSRYAEDVGLIKQIGLNAYRFSLSWARIMPGGEGKVSAEGIGFYDRLIDKLLENRIEPWVTLYHWDLPYSLQLQGGFINRSIVDKFRRYADVVGKHFSDRVKHWVTVNEPINIISCGYLGGNHAPGWRLPEHDAMLCWHHLLLCHGAMVQELRKHGGSAAKIGGAITGWGYIPDHDDNPEEIEAARRLTFDCFRFRHINWFADPMIFGEYPESGKRYFGKHMPKINPADMKEISQPLDYFGTNIYFSHRCDAAGKIIEPPKDAPRTPGDWVVTPSALRWSPRFYYERYKLPIVLLENGVCADDKVGGDGCVHDMFRIEAMKGYLKNLALAIADGVPVEGYFHWSLLDNFEWTQGYKIRFGLAHVDYATQKRTLKDSARFYGEIIRSNGKML